MASILDQYEDSQNIRQHSRVSAANIGITHSGTNLHNLGDCRHYDMWYFTLSFSFTGFVNVRLEEEKPIFNKQRIDFSPPEKINHFSVCNNQLCMSLGKDTLLR